MTNVLLPTLAFTELYDSRGLPDFYKRKPEKALGTGILKALKLSISSVVVYSSFWVEVRRIEKTHSCKMVRWRPVTKNELCDLR